MRIVNYANLEIPDGWEVSQNKFVDLSPDNDYPIDEVLHHFDEDILQARFEGYVIDLGFYGGYWNNREGAFGLYVIRGDFRDGELLERFISRSIKEIISKMNKYFQLIPNGSLDNVKGLTSEHGSPEFSGIDIYSALDNIEVTLTKDEMLEIVKPKNNGRQHGI